MTLVKIATMTGLSLKKVSTILGNNVLHRTIVSDEETAKILHAAAEIGYENKGHKYERKKSRKVTRSMVAEKAGVSPSAVEAAFSKRGIARLSEETRQHVRKIAAIMGYTPTKAHNFKEFYKRKS